MALSGTRAIGKDMGHRISEAFCRVPGLMFWFSLCCIAIGFILSDKSHYHLMFSISGFLLFGGWLLVMRKLWRQSKETSSSKAEQPAV
jgi:hypothetical protein